MYLDSGHCTVHVYTTWNSPTPSWKIIHHCSPAPRRLSPRLHHTKVSGRASGFSFDIICHICHLSVCQTGSSWAFFCPGAPTVCRCAVWPSGRHVKMEGVEWEMWLWLKGPEQPSGDKLSPVTLTNEPAGCPVLSAKLSMLTAPDWPLSRWRNGDSGSLRPVWSWGPLLLLRVTGRCGLHSTAANEVCVGLTGSLLLPWWLLSTSDDPLDSHSDTSPGEAETPFSDIITHCNVTPSIFFCWLRLTVLPHNIFNLFVF